MQKLAWSCALIALVLTLSYAFTLHDQRSAGHAAHSAQSMQDHVASHVPPSELKPADTLQTRSVEQSSEQLETARNHTQSRDALASHRAIQQRTPSRARGFAPRPLTSSVAVQLKPDASPALLAEELAATHWISVDTSAGWYSFDWPNLVETRRAIAKLSAHPSVLVYAQQRSLSFGHKTNDPLFHEQWHLLNTFANTGTPGNDANVEGAWTTGITGEGILIAVLDDGVEHTHPDLAANYQGAHSYDYIGRDSNPAPGDDAGASDNHGTSVAGLAAAVGENALGVSGVAYAANFSALRILGNGQTDAATAAALYTATRPVDVSSNSWGPQDVYEEGGSFFGMYEGFEDAPLTSNAIRNGVRHGRDGLGTVYVWAAGNGRFADNDSNMDGAANLPETIAVTAINQRGRQPSFAEPGANILIGAPTGDSNVVTTDRTGALGYNSGGGSLDADYVGSFDGTSAATPILAGVVALILDANPALTWRDVQHILVRTARVNSPGDSDWIQNGAGYSVNHKFGFGLVDASAAVSLAQNWTNAPTRVTLEQPVQVENAPIPDASSSGVIRTQDVDESLFLEHVQVQIDFTHSFWGDLQIELTSPSGTTSVLAGQGDIRTNGRMAWTYMSVRHWGELARGTWTLNVRDLASQDTGVLHSWKLILHGTRSGVGAMGGTAAIPSISSVSPSGTLERLSEVQIFGNNLSGASVEIGGVAQAVLASNATSLSFVLNNAAPNYAGRVIVTNSLGSGSYEIQLAPALPKKKSGDSGGLCSLRSGSSGGALLALLMVTSLLCLLRRSDASAR